MTKHICNESQTTYVVHLYEVTQQFLNQITKL